MKRKVILGNNWDFVIQHYSEKEITPILTKNIVEKNGKIIEEIFIILPLIHSGKNL